MAKFITKNKVSTSVRPARMYEVVMTLYEKLPGIMSHSIVLLLQQPNHDWSTKKGSS